MRISTLDISGITTTVRRHEALLRFARYLFVYNLAIFLWVVITKLSQMPSFEGLLELLAGPDMEIRGSGAWKRRRKLSNSRTPAVVGIRSDHGSPGRLLFLRRFG